MIESGGRVLGMGFLRRVLLLVWGLGAFLSVSGQGRAKFSITRHDFKEVKEELGPVHTVFSFENAGTGPLRLKSVKASCGCTTPVWSRDSVPAGSQGFVKVEYNPMGRPGKFDKEILVETDGNPQFISLSIHGTVTPRPKGPEDFYPFEEGALRFRTNHLTYGNILHDDTITQSTILYNQGKKPIQFSKSGSKVPSHLKPKMSKSTLNPGDTLTLWVTYIASMKKDWGFAFDNIYLSTNDADRPMKRLNISADIKEHFTSEDRRNPPNMNMPKTSIDMGQIKEGEMATVNFEFKNTGSRTLQIRKVHAACSCIELEAERSLEPGESGNVRLTYNTRGRVGEFEKDATVICNDPDKPEILLQIKGTVVREGSQSGEGE